MQRDSSALAAMAAALILCTALAVSACGGNDGNPTGVWPVGRRALVNDQGALVTKPASQRSRRAVGKVDSAGTAFNIVHRDGMTFIHVPKRGRVHLRARLNGAGVPMLLESGPLERRHD